MFINCSSGLMCCYIISVTFAFFQKTKTHTTPSTKRTAHTPGNLDMPKTRKVSGGNRIKTLPKLRVSKNSPIKGWGGLSKMSKKMSIIELSQIGQDLFDFSDLTWGHPLTHSSTHRYLQTKSNYINEFKLYYISHLTWPHPLTHPLIHTPIHRCGCLNKS